MKYYVVITKDATGDIIQKMGPVSNLRDAERIKSGASINLNHNEYSVQILNEDELREKEGK
ncbi:MAG: hypothetical protein KDK05_26865 [Candidatus Competibacteraceae bacterium]|nr:hypothetical protein [Candidatus Competibacteraceae bacterium]